MSNLSELLPAGAGAKSADFVASGTLASGQTVVLKSDGTVEAVGELSQTVGSAVIFNIPYSNNMSSTYDSGSNKIIVIYNNNATPANGYAVVGTVSGTSISFGTAVVFNSGDTSHTGTTYDSSSNKVVIAYRNNGNSNYGTAIVGTVSGTSISFGTPVVFLSALTQFTQAVYDSSNNKVVLAYYGTSTYGQSVVGTVSGTSISFGATATFLSAAVTALGSTFDSYLNKVVVVFSQGNSYAAATVGTVSGTSISYGTPVTYQSGTVWSNAAVFDSTSNKVIIAYTNNSNSYYGTALVATVSGTTISFGTPVVFASVTSYSSELGFDSNANKVNIAYTQLSATTGKLIVGTVSGTSISFGSSVDTPTSGGDTIENLVIFDSGSNKMVVSFRDVASSSGTSFVFQNVSSNSTSFIGITDEAISSAASGSVIVQGGVNGKVTSLTIGSDYYVQTDGTLNTATSAVNYDIANASYTQAFSVSAQVTFPSGVAFNPTGTKMFVVDNTGDDVNEYTLSTGFDVSTASFVDSFSVNAQQAAPMSVAFNTDGTKMYIVGETEDTVAQYALSTGFDVSSASFTQAFSIASQETEAQGITFNTDGTKMFIVGDTGNDINEYTLSSGFDVSSASFVDSFSFATQSTQPKEAVFNTSGTEMFMLARDTASVYKYTLTTAFDVSTASYASVSFDVSAQESSCQGLAFSADGSKMYVCGDSGDDVNQYATTSTATNSTTVPAGRALSTTSMLLEG
jgi:sugar lactone lactonase YvrE